MSRKAELKFIEELQQEHSIQKDILARKIASLQQRLNPDERAIYAYANMDQDYDMLKTHKDTLNQDMVSLDRQLNVVGIAIDVYTHAQRVRMSDK